MIPAPKRGRPKSRRSSIGWSHLRSRRTNAATRPEPATNSPMIEGELHPRALPNDTATNRATTAGKNSDASHPVERCRILEIATPGDQQDPGDHADDAEGHVHEEDEPPPSGSEQEPADGRAERQSDGLCGALDPDRLAERGPGHGEHDDRHAVRLEQGGADGLDRPEADEPSEAGGESAQRGAEDEDAEPVDVEELAPPHVGEPADGHHGRHQHEEVAEADPGDRADAGVEGVLQGRECDGDDARVELAHEGADAHRDDGEPEGPRTAPDPVGALRFDQEPLPPGRAFRADGDLVHRTTLTHVDREVE